MSHSLAGAPLPTPAELGDNEQILDIPQSLFWACWCVLFVHVWFVYLFVLLSFLLVVVPIIQKGVKDWQKPRSTRLSQ